MEKVSSTGSLAGAGLFALLGALGLVACSFSHDCRISDWFKVRQREPGFEAPHIVEAGEHDLVAFANVNGSWIPVAKARWDQSMDAVAMDRGMSVVFYAEPSWRLLQRGDEAAIPLGEPWCHRSGMTVPHDRKSIVCVSCSSYVDAERSTCAEVTVASFEPTGAQKEIVVAALSPELQQCAWTISRVLWRDEGRVLLATRCRYDSVLVSIPKTGAGAVPIARQSHDLPFSVKDWQRTRPGLPLEEPAYPRAANDVSCE